MSKVTVFTSAAGGVGKTTLSMYSAQFLAKKKSVLLIDLTLHGGIEALIRESKRNTGIGYLLNRGNEQQKSIEASIISSDHLGCDVLLNTDAIQMEKISHEFIDFVIEKFAYYEHIIFDTSFELSERSARLFQVADEIKFVLTQDITVFWRTLKYTEILDKLLVDRKKISLIMNHFKKRIAVNHEEFEDEINIKIESFIPHIKNDLLNAHNSGEFIRNRRFNKAISSIWEVR